MRREKINKFLDYGLIFAVFTLNSTNNSSVVLFSLLLFKMLINFSGLLYNIYEKCLLLLFLLPCFILSFFFDFDLLQFIRLLNLILILFLFPIKNIFKFEDRRLFIFLMLYIFFLQIALVFNFAFVNSFVDQFYPIENNYWASFEYNDSAGINDIVSNRFGGYFYNPNILGVNMYLLFCLYLSLLFKQNKASKIELLVIFLICIISIFLTGSRTSLIALIFTVIYSGRKFIYRYIIPITFSCLILIPIFFYRNIEIFENARILTNIFSLFSDKNDSGYVKFIGFYNYYMNYDYYSLENLVSLFFGKMSWDFQFDAELGYLLSFFGIFGTIMIFLSIALLFFKSDPNLRFVYFIFLVSIGGTIIMNFRFSIVALYLISASYKKISNKCVE